MLTLGVMGGVGSSLIFTPSFTAPGHYFRERRGLATGVATTGGSIGGIAFPLLLERTISTIGFAWAVRVLGFIMVVLAVLANLLVRSRLPPLPDSHSRPDMTIFGQPAFAALTAATFLMEVGLFVPLTYLVSYCLAEGVRPALAYQLLAVLNVGSFFGRWLAGFAADRVGRFNTLIACNALCLVMTAAVWLPARGSMVPMVVYAALFGAGSGSNISLTPVCVGQLCVTEQYGRYYATCYTVVSFGCVKPDSLQRKTNIWEHELTTTNTSV
jgi:predicted MFS family arabinose efflux permease